MSTTTSYLRYLCATRIHRPCILRRPTLSVSSPPSFLHIDQRLRSHQNSRLRVSFRHSALQAETQCIAAQRHVLIALGGMHTGIRQRLAKSMAGTNACPGPVQRLCSPEMSNGHRGNFKHRTLIFSYAVLRSSALSRFVAICVFR